MPVIVFDRGVNTDCPVTFINPIGGYALRRATPPSSSVRRCKPGGKVLALRILPGVDVLETRWSAAKVIFDKSELNVVGVEFTDGDAAKTKTSSATTSSGYGTIDGVWMDAGATAVAAVEAFEDAGKPVPPINGEDQHDFLRSGRTKSSPRSRRPTRPTSGARRSSPR